MVPTLERRDADPVPACALCRLNAGTWTAGGRWFCAKCEGVFGLEGCLARVRLADVSTPMPEKR
jgi:hypothetical protein